MKKYKGYDKWLIKYGIDEANRRNDQYLKRQSLESRTQRLIEKYGEEETNKILENRRNKWKGRASGEKSVLYGKSWIEFALKNHGPEYVKEKCLKMSRKGSKNGSFGKTTLQRMTDLYGEDEAKRKLEVKSEKNRKAAIEGDTVKNLRSVHLGLKNHIRSKFGEEYLENWIINHSNKSSGKNNPMYGKSSPKGSGKGYSGWYKNWYYRSFLELSFILLVIEKYKLKYESAEQRKWQVSYTNNEGVERTYRADFIINDKYMVEIKPKNMRRLPNVLEKRKFAEMFCRSNNLIYKLFSPKYLKSSVLIKMYEDGLIRFSSDKLKEKFRRNYMREAI
jgi:hypothetical protein